MCTMSWLIHIYTHLGVFCRIGSFPKPKTQINHYLGVGKVILPYQRHYPNIELGTMPMCFKRVIYSPFHKLMACFPSICIKFIFLLLLVNQKCWIINIVYLKLIIQHSIQFLTDPDWLITKSNINYQPNFHLSWQYILYFSGISPYFTFWHANYLGGVCNRLEIINFWIV